MLALLLVKQKVFLKYTTKEIGSLRNEWGRGLFHRGRNHASFFSPLLETQIHDFFFKFKNIKFTLHISALHSFGVCMLEIRKESFKRLETLGDHFSKFFVLFLFLWFFFSSFLDSLLSSFVLCPMHTQALSLLPSPSFSPLFPFLPPSLFSSSVVHPHLEDQV